MRQGEKFVCLGEEQYLYMEKKEFNEMPQAVEFCEEDGESVKQMKQIILKMTSYNPKYRPQADVIVNRTAELLLQVGQQLT